MSAPEGVKRAANSQQRSWLDRLALPTPVRRLYERFEHLVHELGKFGVVGGICFGIDLAIFNVLLLAMHLPKYPALAISTTISTTIAFVGNRLWTWRGTERSALHREYGLYIAFNLVGLGITAAVLAISSDWLGGYWPVLHEPIALNLSRIVGVALASAFRFWSYRTFVFQPGQTRTATPNPTAALTSAAVSAAGSAERS